MAGRRNKLGTPPPTIPIVSIAPTATSLAAPCELGFVRTTRRSVTSSPRSRCAPTEAPLARSASRCPRDGILDAFGGSALGAPGGRAISRRLAALATKPARPRGRRRSRGSAGRRDSQADDSASCGRAVSDDFGNQSAAVVLRAESQTSSEGAPSGSARGRGRVEGTSASPIARVCARHPVAGVDCPCLHVRPGAWHQLGRRGGALLATLNGVPGNRRLRIGRVKSWRKVVTFRRRG
jgi:hypothetical protein